MFSCSKETHESSIIPQVTEFNPSQSFFLLQDFMIYSDSASKSVAELLLLELGKLSYDIDSIYPFDDPMKEQSINLLIDSSLNDHPEYYELYIHKKRILIKASDRLGIIHAMYTMIQLIPRSLGINDHKIACLSIKDKPKFKWRGMLLDCSRHFMDINFIKRYIDLLAFHKMNVLHWHLTDDQAWRIEIKQYPKLTSMGSFRKQKDGSLYGGFYSQEQITDIIYYASQRGVCVIPEIELPGHCIAALAAYPEYSCSGGPFEVETDWGVFKEIYCAGNDQTFTFLENILDEVISLFPSEYIHIGGDEVPKYRWERCEKCISRMVDQELEDVHELQSYFIQRIETYLNEKGKKIIGWDEILEGGLAQDATVQSWRSFEGAAQAAKMGHDAIVSPTSHAYFDYNLNAIDLKKVYSFDPIPEGLTEKESLHIIGGECNMWSERAPQDKIDSKVFPRILAMSEILWTSPEHKDYDRFYKRVQNHYKRLDQLNVDYGLESVPIRFSSSYSADSFHVDLQSGSNDLELFYQLDQGEVFPYEDSFSISDIFHVKSWATKNSNSYGDTLNIYLYAHKGIEADLSGFNEYFDGYSAGGNHGIMDGLRGSTDFRDGRWQGYSGNDFEVTIDLKDVQSIDRVVSSFFQYNLSWIFIPIELKVYISLDGESYFEKGHLFPNVPPDKPGQFYNEFEIKFPATKARYVKFKAKNLGVCPKWHSAAESPAWLFVDEIQVY